MSDDDAPAVAAAARPREDWRARLLDARVRTLTLVAATLVLAAAAVVVGLPSPAVLPTGLGRIIVLPVLPADPVERERYRLVVHWADQRAAYQQGYSWSGLSWDTYWAPHAAGTTDGEAAIDPETMAGPPIFVAIDDEATATWLRSCAGGDRGEVTEVTELPTEQADLLQQLDLAEWGAARDHVYFRLDDVGVTEGWWDGFCLAAPEATTAGDDVEMHTTLPELSVLLPDLEELYARPTTTTTPAAGSGGEVARPADAQVLAGFRVDAWVDVLPLGWSDTQIRAVHGSFRDAQSILLWEAVVAEDPRGAPLTLLETGPITLESVSLPATRQASRDLFWSGLLVGLAGSCALMLFEAIPWRRASRTDE